MKYTLLRNLLIFFCVSCFIQCNKSEVLLKSSIKNFPKDPFKDTIIPSQFFEIDPKKDNVIEGKYGTVLVLPKKCFKTANGKVVSDIVIFELAEALMYDQMILSNLTTTSNGKLLETDGMIYINASADGKQVIIDNNNPIHIEIPTSKKKQGMEVYRGVRNDMGDMDWLEPQALNEFLIPLNMDLLNFYPEGFEDAVLVGLPYKNHTVISKFLIDSLYYSLSVSDGRELVEGFGKLEYNESTSKINEEGKTSELGHSIHASSNCGVDPAIIKTIRSKQFQNTLISTREFEERLQAIFKLCNPEIIDIYVKNLDKNLWELDSIVFEKLLQEPEYHTFKEFYNERKTKIEIGNKNAELLRSFYQNQLTEIKSDLEDLKNELVKKLSTRNTLFNESVRAYKELLQKREKYRMETYGFERTEMGWINIDIGTEEKDWEYQKLEMVVKNGQQYDRVNTFVIYSSIKSLYKLNSSDNELFFVGNDEQREMPIPMKKNAVGFAIAYKGDTSYFAKKEFITGSELVFELKLKESTIQEITRAINQYDTYGEENNITKELDLLDEIAAESKRQNLLISESVYISNLWFTAMPCCIFDEDGIRR